VHSSRLDKELITLFDLAIKEQIFPPTPQLYRHLLFFANKVSFARAKLITSYEIRTLPPVPGSQNAN